MKKIYVHPSFSEFVVSTSEDILTGSTLEMAVSNEEFDTENMSALSRRHHDVWGDDEE